MLTLLLLALQHAEAGAPVRLPPEESLADWKDALLIAGLTPGVPGDGAWVDVIGGPTTWTVRVRDTRGEIHEATVARPDTEVEREDLASLAASLLVPVYEIPLPPPPAHPAPEPPPPPVVRKPKPPPPAPVVEPVVVPEPPPPVVVVVEPPPPPPPPPAPRTRFELRAGIGADLRASMQPALGGWLDGRVMRSGPFSFGLTVGASAPARVTTLMVEGKETDLQLWSGEAEAVVWYAGDTPIPFHFGVSGGAAMRSFLEDGAPAQSRDGGKRVEQPALGVPLVATSANVSLGRGRWVFEPGVRLQVDARPIDINADGAVTRLPDWSVRAGMAVRILGGSAE